MSYFENFPNTFFEINGNTFLVKDILRRSKFVKEVVNYISSYEIYEITDGESFQSIAYNLYGSATYHWILLLFNEIHNITTDWPMDQNTLLKYIQEKYGENNVFKIRHWEYNGLIIGEYSEFNSLDEWIEPVNPDEDNLFMVPVSFYDYETKVNDAKRKIKILRVELLSEFISEFKKSINE